MADCKTLCVVTGCSRGIGLQTALQLSNVPDFTVVATLRTLSDASSELQSCCDVQALDVSEDGSVSALAKYVQNKYGRCDVLVNNAGFGIPGSLEQVSVDHAKTLFDVNVWGVMRMCQQFVPLMRLNSNGLIVTVSSTSGVCGMPFMDLYTASKQAVEGLMESYRYSVEGDNIKVMLINPGPTDTDFATRYEEEAQHTHDNENKSTISTVNLVASRNKAGQPAHECAAVIVKLITENVHRNIADGSDAVTFWNGTSEFSRSVIEQVLRYPSGHDGIYAKRFGISRDSKSS